MCGGASTGRSFFTAGRGRSPRVRGSRLGRAQVRAPSGSIPACAGEPNRSRPAHVVKGVDPRVCGGAVQHDQTVLSGSGRSPRVRGSLRSGSRDLRGTGSIPACAGEPPTSARCCGRIGVDPRVCGGAVAAATWRLLRGGRSPRVRGSQVGHSGLHVRIGSIPACAGEPGQGAPRGRPSGVDPRVCGGASIPTMKDTPAKGRSPRVRGSQVLRHADAGLQGSIPACAGEPRAEPRWLGEVGVDPRVCGGAALTALTSERARGRSPRVRGSHKWVYPIFRDMRSIPACAGEPSARRAGCSDQKVDPRVCGGASRS